MLPVRHIQADVVEHMNIADKYLITLNVSEALHQPYKMHNTGYNTELIIQLSLADYFELIAMSVASGVCYKGYQPNVTSSV